MEAQEKRCLRCNGRFEEGFITDFVYGGVNQSTWFEGKATNEHGFGLQVDNRGRLPVDVYRCTRCGMLELYALEAPPA